MFCDIRDYGALADGKTLNTQAIQAAIDAVAQAGGGTVLVPPGTWLTGTINLCSNLVFELAAGAVLLGSPNLSDYQCKTWGHHGDRTPWHLLYAGNAANVTIQGRGTIRGNGKAFWNPQRASDWHFWSTDHHRPSPMVEIEDCRQVLIQDVVIEDSAGWTLHLYNSRHVRIQGLTIRNTFFGPNSDGIDLTGCQDVLIQGCDIATGDDAIALKTTDPSDPCERIVITGCLLQTTCVAVRIGFESKQDFRDIVVSDVVVRRCSRVIDLRALEGCTIERVTFSNIIAATDSGWPINRPIEVLACAKDNVFTPDRLPEGHPLRGIPNPATRRSLIRDITFSDLDITTDGRCLLVADDGDVIDGVRFHHLTLRYVLVEDLGVSQGKTGGLSYLPMSSMDEVAKANGAVVARNVRHLEIRDWRVLWPQFPVKTAWFNLDGSPHPVAINPGFWQHGSQALRQGVGVAPFPAFTGFAVSDSHLDTNGLTGFGGADPVVLHRCQRVTTRS